MTTGTSTGNESTGTGSRAPAQPTGSTLSVERADLLAELAKARFFLRNTARELTDEQAGQRSTVSSLCVGGLIKHVAATERQWVDFILDGPTAMSGGKAWTEFTEEDFAEYARGFQMVAGDTLAGLLDDYQSVAQRTDDLVAELDLDAAQPLPEAPWFEPGARWSARRVLLHIVAETAQHAGHADIIREAIDGAKSMG